MQKATFDSSPEPYHSITLSREALLPMTETEFNRIVYLIQHILTGNALSASANCSSDGPEPRGPSGPPSIPEQSSSLHDITQVIKLSVPCSQMHKSNDICTSEIPRFMSPLSDVTDFSVVLAADTHANSWRAMDTVPNNSQTDLSTVATSEPPGCRCSENKCKFGAIQTVQSGGLVVLPDIRDHEMVRNFSGSTACPSTIDEHSNFEDCPICKALSNTNTQVNNSPAALPGKLETCLGCRGRIEESDVLDHMASCQDLR